MRWVSRSLVIGLTTAVALVGPGILLGSASPAGAAGAPATIYVSDPMTGGPITLPTATVGQPYNVQLVLPPADDHGYVYDAQGDIPYGLTLVPTGQIVGTPILPSRLTFTVGVQVGANLLTGPPLTLPVSTGIATVDLLAMPLGTLLEEATQPVLGDTAIYYELIQLLVPTNNDTLITLVETLEQEFTGRIPPPPQDPGPPF